MRKTTLVTRTSDGGRPTSLSSGESLQEHHPNPTPSRAPPAVASSPHTYPELGHHARGRAAQTPGLRTGLLRQEGKGRRVLVPRAQGPAQLESPHPEELLGRNPPEGRQEGHLHST